MNVASLELCRELYELSGWRDVSQHYSDDELIYLPSKYNLVNKIPAYDLGYLLRKLPVLTELHHESNGEWRATINSNPPRYYADTPENALCQLAIGLFKQKVQK